MSNGQKDLRIRKIKLHILNHVTLKLISMPSSIKYNLTKVICKCVNLQTVIITNISLFSVHSKQY